MFNMCYVLEIFQQMFFFFTKTLQFGLKQTQNYYSILLNKKITCKLSTSTPYSHSDIN